MLEDAVIYTKNLCPYCNMAKDLLKKKDIKFKEINLTSSPHMVKEMLKKSNGKKTMPQIFLGSKHIGGYDDLYVYFRTDQIRIE
jgi:glutaredoxin 3